MVTIEKVYHSPLELTQISSNGISNNSFVEFITRHYIFALGTILLAVMLVAGYFAIHYWNHRKENVDFSSLDDYERQNKIR